MQTAPGPASSLYLAQPLTTILMALPSFSQAIENIDTLTNLQSLFLGKNKITKLQNLDALTNLTVLSMQVLTSAPAPKPPCLSTVPSYTGSPRPCCPTVSEW